MKIAVTKYRLAINYGMLLLAVAIIVNTTAMAVLMALEGLLPRYLIGFSISFIGLFVYGFQYFWHGSRVFYHKKVKQEVDISTIPGYQKDETEKSNVFVTEEGKLLF
jgi:hypothetical protein